MVNFWKRKPVVNKVYVNVTTYDPPFWSKVWGLIPDLIQGENGFIQLLSRIILYFIPDKSKFYPRSDPYFTPDLIHILSRIIIYFIPDFSLNFTADHITSDFAKLSCDFSYRKSITNFCIGFFKQINIY